MQRNGEPFFRLSPVCETSWLRADEAEALRTLPQASVNALRESGLFTLKLPAVLGGAEADPVTQVEVIEAVSYIDPSAGWNLMIGAGGLSLCAFLPDEAIEQMFHGGRIPTLAGAIMPGRAVPVDGGYRVTGRWSWASGIRHAEWVGAHVLVERQGGNPPESRFAILSAADVEIHDTWHVAGLKGTGSCDFSATDLFVPEGFTFDLQAMQPNAVGRCTILDCPVCLSTSLQGSRWGPDDGRSMPSSSWRKRNAEATGNKHRWPSGPCFSAR